MKHPDSTVAKSSKRPDLLADHFENKQWCIVFNAEIKEDFRKKKVDIEQIYYSKKGHLS